MAVHGLACEPANGPGLAVNSAWTVVMIKSMSSAVSGIEIKKGPLLLNGYMLAIQLPVSLASMFRGDIILTKVSIPYFVNLTT